MHKPMSAIIFSKHVGPGRMCLISKHIPPPPPGLFKGEESLSDDLHCAVILTAARFHTVQFYCGQSGPTAGNEGLAANIAVVNF